MKKCLLIFLLLFSKTSFSQLLDNFTDENFTNNPVWNGSNSGNDFLVASQQLRSNSTVPNSNFYLSTPNNLASNCTWEFWIGLKFATSGANYVDVYLTSDTENLQAASLNGFFVRVGNTEDEISLYKRTGTAASSIKLIDGLNSSVASSTNNTVRIRVTRMVNGSFTLERDVTGTGNSYFKEGEVTDPSLMSSSYFGFLVQQSTTSFSQKHFFDDIRIEPIQVDVTSPAVVSARSIDSLTLEVRFDERVDTVTALDPANFTLTPANVVSSVTTTADPAVFRITLAAPLRTGQHHLMITGVADLAGNLISPTDTQFPFVLPYGARKNDIVINEVFADPAPQVDLPSVEFIELLNSTDHAISLRNWTYSDPTTVYTFSNDSIRAKEYLILCSKADTAEFKRFGRVVGISPWPSLNNSGDQLKLVNEKGIVISDALYADSWYRNAEKKSGGWSLERVDPLSACNGITAWSASVNMSGGTPGALNSVYIPDSDNIRWKIDSIQITADTSLAVFLNKPIDPGALNTETVLTRPTVGGAIKPSVDASLKQIKLQFDGKFTPGADYSLEIIVADCSGTTSAIVGAFKTPLRSVRPDTARVIISEIFADPSPEVGLPLAEFVEILNTGNDAVDLSGWTLSDSSSKAPIKKAVILPGEYVILCAAADTSQYKAFGRTIGISPWPSLNNSAEQIRLRSFTNRIVDSVYFADSWYRDGLKKQGGWTLERLDPLSQCNGITAWGASNNPTGGTPGAQNSLHDATFEQLKLKADSVVRLSDTSIVVYLNKPIDPITLQTGKFSLTPGLEALVKPSIDISLQQVKLRFSQKFASGEEYKLNMILGSCTAGTDTIAGIFKSSPLPSLPPARLDTARIIISEIFADPSPEVGLPLAEFVEVHNPGNDTVDITGWTLNDPTSKGVIKSGSIPPGGFLILCPVADTSSYIGLGLTVGISPWPSLNNTSDQIILKSFSKRTVDSVAYRDSWYKDPDKMQGGWTLELVDPWATCPGKGNWAASKEARGGTPGQPNSIFRPRSIAQPLRLLAAVLIDSVTVKLEFNQTPDSLSASSPANYLFSNGLGHPATVSAAGDEALELRFPNRITRGNNYRVLVQNVTDCAGSVISSASNSAEFFYPKRIEKGDVVINEILFNPRSGGTDFVEIYNLSRQDLDLKDLQLATIKGDSLVSIKPLSSESRIFKPAEYLVLTIDPENIGKEYTTAHLKNLIKTPSLPGFNDDEGVVVLMSEGLQIDRLDYSEKMHFKLIKDPEGVSLERSSFNRPTNDRGNFRSAAASTGFATPGYRNSQSTEEVPAEQEVSLLSQTFSPDNDGFEDVLEMKYKLLEPGWVANVSIYTDKGIPIKKIASNMTLSAEGTLNWDGLNEKDQRAPVGIYVLHVEIFNLNGQVKKYRRTFALATRLD